MDDSPHLALSIAIFFAYQRLQVTVSWSSCVSMDGTRSSEFRSFHWFLLLLPASRFGWCGFLAMLRVTGKVGENGQSSSQWPRRSAWIRPSVAAHGDMSILVGAMTVWRIWLREWRAAGFTFCVFTCSLWTYVCVYSHKLVCDRYRLGHRPVLS